MCTWQMVLICLCVIASTITGRWVLTKSLYGDTLTCVNVVLNLFRSIEGPTSEGFYEILSHTSSILPNIVVHQSDTITKQASSLVLKGMSQLFQCCTISSVIGSFVCGLEIHQYATLSDPEISALDFACRSGLLEQTFDEAVCYSAFKN